MEIREERKFGNGKKGKLVKKEIGKNENLGKGKLGYREIGGKGN